MLQLWTALIHLHKMYSKRNSTFIENVWDDYLVYGDSLSEKSVVFAAYNIFPKISDTLLICNSQNKQNPFYWTISEGNNQFSHYNWPIVYKSSVQYNSSLQISISVKRQIRKTPFTWIIDAESWPSTGSLHLPTTRVNFPFKLTRPTDPVIIQKEKWTINSCSERG